MSYQRPQISRITLPAKVNGSALLVALFVIILMTLLGGAILKMQMTSSETIAQEVLGTRALAAARSGMQIHLYKNLPFAGATASCFNQPYNFSSIEGLNNCRATVTCENYANHDGVAYIRLVSTGECGSGTMANDSKNIVLSSRTIQVEARRL